MHRAIGRFALLALPCLLGCDSAVDAIRPELSHESTSASIADPRFTEWSTPVNLGTTVNSPFVDNLPELSSDGLSLYFTSNRPGGSGALDLWVARRESPDGAWGAPVNITSVNSAFNDAAPNLSRDGHYLIFTSNRPGGHGDNDLWASWRANPNDDFGWQEPVNLGDVLNSAAFDAGAAFVQPEFYFTRGTTSQSLNIYVSRMIGDQPSAPVLVEELSSAANEQRPTLRFDRREIFFASTRTGGSGLDDIWGSTRVSAAARWSTPVNIAEVNSPFVDTQPGLSEDGMSLFISSTRPGGSGGLDLWMASRRR